MKRLLHQLYTTGKQHFAFKPVSFARKWNWFLRDMKKLKKEPNNNFRLSNKHLIVCLEDKTTNTPLDYVYFYQNAWAASKIFEYRPASHVDIGSQVGFVGIVSQFVPTVMIDIRPIDVELKGLQFMAGDILQLPIADNELESVSSICVIEHIGLGRYGDGIDAQGSEKAIREIKRVTKPGGNILFTVPVDSESRVFFNAHRAFTREQVVSLFEGCSLVEERYIYGSRIFNQYEPAKGFGTGLFYFKKDQ